MPANNSSEQTALVVHDTDKKLKATDTIGRFPDETIKRALSKKKQSKKKRTKLPVNNSSKQTALIHDTNEKLKATDVISRFPDETIKRALSNSSISSESPLFHFIGLFEVAQEYILFNEFIPEDIKSEFGTLSKQMNFHLELVKETVKDEM